MLLSFLPPSAPQDVRVSYDQFAGLQVRVNGIPIVKGSAFQYFDSSGRSLYSSRWAPKTVETLPDGTIQVRYSGDNGNAIGTLAYTPRYDGFTARLQFKWRGSGTVRIENTLALLWAPAFSHSNLDCNGQPVFGLIKPIRGEWAERKMCSGQKLTFDANLAKVTLKTPASAVALYDARNLSQDWARTSCLFWLGNAGLKASQNEITEYVADWSIEALPLRRGETQAVHLVANKTDGVIKVDQRAPVLVPRPATVSFNALRNRLDVLKSEDCPESAWVKSQLEARWDTSPFGLDLEIRKPVPGIKRNGYRLDIQPTKVVLQAADQVGVNRGLSVLVQSARPEAGKLVLPCGTVTDAPIVGSRGVHIFSGAANDQFPTHLVKNLFAPLGFNSLVVECERSQWQAVPEAQRKGRTPVEDLVKLFDDSRRVGIEPVPLVQSLGHMDWLLDGPKRNLAVNPAVPYTLDARKKAARDLLESVWTEVIEALHPTLVQFGLDEADMRGMPDDPTLATRIWVAQVPNLVRFARSHRVAFGMWGDMMLATGDAPDATHAPSNEQATERRAKVPAGTTVYDWHYLSTDDPAKFTSLDKWKAWGMKPIAASWSKPKNIRAHTLAAIKSGVGTLQTTWAGYSTGQSNFETSPEQLASYVLAAEYAWTGRTEAPGELGYDPLDVARSFLWPDKAPTSDHTGSTWLPAGHPKTDVRIGGVLFHTMPFAALNTPLTGPGSFGAQKLVFDVQGQFRHVALAMDSVGWETEAEPVARLTVLYEDGSTTEQELRYGTHVRAEEDDRGTLLCERKDGLSTVRIETSGRALKSIELEPISQTAGVRVRGLSTW